MNSPGIMLLCLIRLPKGLIYAHVLKHVKVIAVKKSNLIVILGLFKRMFKEFSVLVQILIFL